MTTTAPQLAAIDAKLAILSHGLEPRRTARRILELLNERERLLGSYARTCLECGEPFTASRADRQYCSRACQQSAYRRRALRLRVTASSEIRPVCGVAGLNGQSGGSTTASPTASHGAAT